MKELAKAYNPKDVEKKWYKFWEESGYFYGEVSSKKKPFCITIPPPNVTGESHIGHALCYTLQDVLARWKRMQGYATLCLPGMDHASIAVHRVVEEQLAKEGLSRHLLGREKFLERVWQWKNECSETIKNQFKILGFSFDWSKERFTMDEDYVDAVLETFVRFYNKGYIYRGQRVTNWCPGCQTAISDIEVDREERKEFLYYVSYPLEDGSGSITVATTRPETMLGDTAVAVHPKDERYQKFVGKILVLPLMERRIPIITDEIVDIHFGTGAVKVTPAHDINDFEIAGRHSLPKIVVIGKDGKMTKEAGVFANLDRYQAREEVLRELKAKNYLVKIEDYPLVLGLCERCHTAVEPLLSEQWFMRMKELAVPAIHVVKEGKIKFVPEQFTKVYLDWMENIRDWCISRQLWWGHRIPVWYCQKMKNPKCKMQNGVIVSKIAPQICPYCGSKELVQDEDILDTWFSSALWPFATLGWPKETEELRYFYPTSIMVTGSGIIHLWVARMIITGLEFMQDIPFSSVYINATVLNEDGKRMSKSLGTGIDPLEMIEQYGVDATRFGLMVQAGKAQEIRFGYQKAEMARNFTNKIHNAARFILTNLSDLHFLPSAFCLLPSALELPDRWILSRYHKIIEEVNQVLEEFSFDEASQRFYDFFWHDFCDWYLEIAKLRLGGEEKEQVQSILLLILEGSLRLLHPFMPFITEEIWQKLPRTLPKVRGESIMLANYPKSDKKWFDTLSENQMETIQKIVMAIRNIRSEMNLPPSQMIELQVKCSEPLVITLLLENLSIILNLTRSKNLIINDKIEKPKLSASSVIGQCEIFVPLADLLDVEKEKARLAKEVLNLSKLIDSISRKLTDQAFLNKAPKEVIEREEMKRREYTEKRERLERNLAVLMVLC
ncbi:MAG: valine--tRNA ligase [Candidatus Edwardsbacteria bacterium]